MYLDPNHHQPILEVEALTIARPDGQELVRNVSFSLPLGKTLGIVGESGSGKSLTCRALLGLLPEGLNQTRGRVRVLGRDLADLSTGQLRALRRQSFGAVFQDPGSYLNPSVRIGVQVAESVIVHAGGSRGNARATAVRLLDEVGLDAAVQNCFPHELSGGMLQRVLIAIALSGNPGILIADEVTTALDVVVQAQILALLQDHKTQRSLSMVMVSHDLALVSQVCDYLVVMKDGVVVEQGLRQTVLRHPSSAYTRLLIDNHLRFGLDAYDAEPAVA